MHCAMKRASSCFRRCNDAVAFSAEMEENSANLLCSLCFNRRTLSRIFVSIAVLASLLMIVHVSMLSPQPAFGSSRSSSSYSVDVFASDDRRSNKSLLSKTFEVGVLTKLEEDAYRLAVRLHQSGSRRSKTDGRWKSFVRPFRLFAYSAFYDDRITIRSLPLVRVIVVAERMEDVKLYCVLAYSNRQANSEAYFSKIGLGVILDNTHFREYVVTCRCDNEDIPSHVSLYFVAGQSKQFWLPVELPFRPPVKENFCVCVSVSYWRHSPAKLIEWMEMLKLLGVSLVVVYNNSLNALSARVMQHYDAQSFVEFRQSHNFINSHEETNLHLHMSPVINDCMYRNMYRFRYVIVTDLDEIIVPRHHDDYLSMVESLKKTSMHVFADFGFSNQYFFYDLPPFTESELGPSTTLRFRIAAPVSEIGYSMKSIVHPLGCASMQNHYCWNSTGNYNSMERIFMVDPSIARLHHYKLCHFDSDECSRYFGNSTVVDTMLHWKEPLLRAMREQFEALGLPWISKKYGI